MLYEGEQNETRDEGWEQEMGIYPMKGGEMKEEKAVKWVCTGSRLKMGTDWPIETILYRRGKPLVPGDSERSKPWKVVFNLCNGVPTSTRFYRTKKEALEAMD